MSAPESIIKKVKIVAVHTETPQSKTFVLEPLDGWQPEYQAGQFLTFVFQTPYGEKRRSYSISSAPESGEPLSITVKKVDNGEFSRFLVYQIKTGDILYTSGISGFFQLPARPRDIEQFFFLAAGSGITPCFSLIKTILTTGTQHVVLIYSNKTEEVTIFLQALLDLQQKYTKRFTVRFLYSNRFNVYHSRLSKWLLLHLLEEYPIASKDKAYFYLCGPFDYMQTIRITLLGESIPAAHIVKEDFSSLPRLLIPKPPDTSAHQVTITLPQQTYEVKVQYPQSILASAKAQHIALPYSCEAGRCGSCVATCTKGKVWMAYNEVLTDQEIAKGRILTCQSFPIDGDVEIFFPELS
ncbi:MAG: flavodoxin reductase (ferredoxin-NADPH reductase) family 1 [Chitinophagaceae bacterium]|nr:flavodoxin reductase (ferredoxin-NADPH reductase) family 1 [Chitinophagaceae bacterium]